MMVRENIQQLKDEMLASLRRNDGQSNLSENLTQPELIVLGTVFYDELIQDKKNQIDQLLMYFEDAEKIEASNYIIKGLDYEILDVILVSLSGDDTAQISFLKAFTTNPNDTSLGRLITYPIKDQIASVIDTTLRRFHNLFTDN